MKVAATINNTRTLNDIIVSTDNIEKNIVIPGKPDGNGSSVNGGELLFLALATCFCNDLYREAARRKIELSHVEVKVTGEFGKEGEPASHIGYQVNVQSTASKKEIANLIRHVDEVAEVHNTLRKGIQVGLKH